MYQLPDFEQAVVAMTREFVDKEVRPVVRELDHTDTYPDALINQMKELGFFGLLVPEEFGGNKVSALCFAMVTEELSRGWMSLAGAIGGHSVTCHCILQYGTPEQKQRYLPVLATGAGRGAMALTEPQGGSDLQSITTTAVRDGDHYVINGSKTWITNARHARFVSLLVKTDKEAAPAYKGISLFIAEPGPGFTVSRNLPKLGYKGVESCELHFEDFRVPAAALLGGVEGQGFLQMMNGLEIGRIQVAARALGVAQAALEDSIRYAQERVTFGKPIWQHQAVGHMLAEMATKLEAARLLVHRSAVLFDQGKRCDMEAGMGKLFASEVAQEISLAALRIHGGYGYSQEFHIERYYRDAPLMIVGEGTNEIQKNVIVRQLIQRNRIQGV